MTKDHQVVHVSPEAHATAKRFCKERGLILKEWASAILIDAVENRIQPVRKIPTHTCTTNETDVAQLPPFWKNRKKRAGRDKPEKIE